MRAVVLNSGRAGVELDYPRPRPAEGEVVVRVLRAGICETDLQLMQGYLGFHGVLGHEFVGVAEEGRFRGQRVVGEINCRCGACDYCQAGLGNHCPYRSVLGILNHDGVFADFVAVPERNLHPVPDELPTDVAVFTEPLAAAFRIPEQIPLTQKMRVVVLGDGRLGNLCAQVMAICGCQLTVVGKHRHKLALLERSGMKTALLEDASPERTADVVVDCTGSPTGLQTALQWVKPRGTIMLKTTIAELQRVAMAPLVIDEITVIGSRCGPFRRALQALQSGEIDVTPLVVDTYPLDEAVTALREAHSQPVLKLLLSMER